MTAQSQIISGSEALQAFVAAAGGAPAATALVCDIDGTISPIAPRPADARVPEQFRELLAALVKRLGLVVFATGRGLEDGRRMIP
ncbi:MAG: HAD hydrolase family protein, partial [Thermoleophilia bacterium]|nr:HAD hydrolase family protein [Thermoleophilia bacterium]